VGFFFPVIYLSPLVYSLSNTYQLGCVAFQFLSEPTKNQPGFIYC